MAKMVKVEKKKHVVKKPHRSTFGGVSGILLILFFLFSGIYLSWMHLVPIYFNNTYTPDKVSEFLSSKIGFDIKTESIKFYTTPSCSVGFDMKNIIVNYPVHDGQKFDFMKVRHSNIELDFLSYVMKTINFRKFALNGITVDLYQDENGRYPFVQQIEANFNPKMPNFTLVPPKIEINGFSFKNFSAQTQQYRVINGKKKIITQRETEKVLKSTNSHTIKVKALQ